MAKDKIYRPIKVVLPQNEDYQKKPGGGGSRKIFDEFGIALQSKLRDDTLAVHEYFEHSFSQWPDIPAVARVKLHSKAIAKSHRPINFFFKAGCPIIGSQEIGTLLIRVTPRNLDKLVVHVMKPSTHDDIAQVSTMAGIKPYSEKDTLGTLANENLTSQIDQGLGKLKLRLFNHLDPAINSMLRERLMSIINLLGLSAERLEYPWGLSIFRVRDISASSLNHLIRFVGTQRLGPFPRLGMVTKTSVSVRPARSNDFPPPRPENEYPLVGVIDSGVRPNDPLLGPWLEASEYHVAGQDFAPDHGTFVCSLIVNARILNHNDPRLPGSGAKIVNVAAIPKGGIEEDELLYIIEESLKKYPAVKTWNLSVSIRNSICRDDGFSTMAMKLDELQDRYGVTIVVPSGNFETPPLRSWPVLIEGEARRLGEDDRITSPADSVRAMTVGSLAHAVAPNTCVLAGDPSPFSRRGPGPGFIFKPELTYFGGNCDQNGDFSQVGVLALNDQGHIAEDVGTSFSTPMVTTTLANVHHALAQEHTSNLTKALLIHSAVLRNPELNYNEVRYKGFGYPQDVDQILGCNFWEATFIFEDEIGGPLRNNMLKMEPFPIPECLVTQKGKVRGEFVVTLVYNPQLNPAFGAEYCQTELEVSMGRYHPSSRKYERQVPPVETDYKKLYEEEQIKQAMKWYPVKGYHRETTQGIMGTDWSLRLLLTTRAGVSLDKPQHFALLVTVRDPKKEEPVYQDAMAALRKTGWLSQDLQLRDRIRAHVS